MTDTYCNSIFQKALQEKRQEIRESVVLSVPSDVFVAEFDAVMDIRDDFQSRRLFREAVDLSFALTSTGMSESLSLTKNPFPAMDCHACRNITAHSQT